MKLLLLLLFVGVVYPQDKPLNTLATTWRLFSYKWKITPEKIRGPQAWNSIPAVAKSAREDNEFEVSLAQKGSLGELAKKKRRSLYTGRVVSDFKNKVQTYFRLYGKDLKEAGVDQKKFVYFIFDRYIELTGADRKTLLDAFNKDGTFVQLQNLYQNQATAQELEVDGYFKRYLYNPSISDKVMESLANEIETSLLSIEKGENQDDYLYNIKDRLSAIFQSFAKTKRTDGQLVIDDLSSECKKNRRVGIKYLNDIKSITEHVEKRLLKNKIKDKEIGIIKTFYEDAIVLVEKSIAEDEKDFRKKNEATVKRSDQQLQLERLLGTNGDPKDIAGAYEDFIDNLITQHKKDGDDFYLEMLSRHTHLLTGQVYSNFIRHQDQGKIIKSYEKVIRALDDLYIYRKEDISVKNAVLFRIMEKTQDDLEHGALTLDKLLQAIRKANFQMRVSNKRGRDESTSPEERPQKGAKR